MTNLTDAIQLIRQGRKDDARLLLESVLKLDPKNIQAWFWYVETMPTLEKRIQILEVCLKVNPGNPQVLQALQTLRGQQTPQVPPPPAYSSTPTRVDPFTSTYDPEPLESEPAYDDGSSQSATYGLEEDEDYLSAAPSESVFDYDGSQPGKSSKDFYPPPSAASKPAFDWDALEREENVRLGKSSVAIPMPAIETIDEEPARPPARSYPFYTVWFTALFPLDIGAFSSMLDDPEGGTSRAFEWMAITGVITGLLAPFFILRDPDFSTLFNMPEFRSLLGGMNPTTLMIILMAVMAVLSPILNILGLALNGAILNFLAMAFGGNGNFSRTVYAMAAFLAPASLLTSLFTLIPGLQCVAAVLGLYISFLYLRALMAAHDLTTWGAIKTVLAPTVLLFILICLIILVLGMPSLAF